MAAPALVGLGTLILARTGLRLRTRPSQQPDDADDGVGEDDRSKLRDGSSGSAKEADDVPVAESPGAKAFICDMSTSNLVHGATICLVGPGGELMGLTTTSGKAEDMSLLPISTTTVETGSCKRIQSYPAHSIFIVIRQEHDISFSSMGAAGMLLESSKDVKMPLKVSGRKPTKHHTWRLANGELVSNATGEKLNLKPQLLHAFSVDEMRDRERAVNNRERQLQAEVKHLRDRLRKDALDHNELTGQFAEERQQAESDILELQARVQEQQKALKEADADCRRKGALLKQLEARLADISMGSDGAADGQGAMSDIIRHWQEQVAIAEDRAAAAAADHADQAATVRDEHARAMAALRQEHSAALEALQVHAAAAEERAMAVAEAKQLSKLAEAEPAIAALQARTMRQGDKIRQQNDVIRELAGEVERLSDIERELLDEVQRLSYADHALTNISRSIVEATTPRDPQAITVPRNPWQDRETQHERLVRQASFASSLSGRSRPYTADSMGAEGHPGSSGKARRLSAGDSATLRESLKARRLSATAEAAQGIAVAREAIARSTAHWPSPPRPHMPTSLVPQTSVPEDEPLFTEGSGRPWSARSTGSGMNFATAFSDGPTPVATGGGNADSSALMDTTNSPRARECHHGLDEALSMGRSHGPCADENAPHRDAGGVLVQGSHGGAQARRRVGMGQADVELSKAAKEEMSVLQHNTRVLSQRQKRRPLCSTTAASGARAAVDEPPFDAQSDAGSTSANPAPAASTMRRSVSLGSKPRPPALDLTCIPDLIPDAADLAGAPAGADSAAATAAAPQATVDDSAAVGATAPPAVPEGAVNPAQAVVRTPVAQRVLRMNKLSEVQDIQRQPTGSDLSRAGSSIPVPRSGLQRTVSSMSASRKSSESRSTGTVGAPAAEEPASKLRRSVSGNAVLPCGSARLQRRPASTEDLRRSVESTGLKVHAARSAALGTTGRNWTARPPTAPNPCCLRLAGGKGVTHQQCSSTMDNSQAASDQKQALRQLAPSTQQLADDPCTVHHIVNKFSSPEKAHCGDSPRWARNRSLGTRSRHAQRALGVFPSRSFSAGASGASLSSKLRGSVATQASGSGLRCNSSGPDMLEQGIDDRTCSRRLSMGDPRVRGPGPSRNGTTGATQDEESTSCEVKREQAGTRPMFLHRNAVQSIDVKPW